MEKRILKDVAAYGGNMPIGQGLLYGEELNENENKSKAGDKAKEKTMDETMNKTINRAINILAIDIGNSNIVYALFEGRNIVFTVRSATDRGKTSDDIALDLLGIFNMNNIDIGKVDGFAVSSVVPEVCNSLLAAIKRISGKEVIIAGTGTSGLKMKVDKPGRVGADRITNAVAALWKHGNVLPAEPLVIVDLGTATTVSVLDKDGAFIGGCICPGVMTSMKALANSAAQLPAINISNPAIHVSGNIHEGIIKNSSEFDNSNSSSNNKRNADGVLNIIAKNTEDCMRAGIVYGTASMLDGITERIEEELGTRAKTIATGGLAQSIIMRCKKSFIYEPNLLLEGLYRIYMLNSRGLSEAKVCNTAIQRGGGRYE